MCWKTLISVLAVVVGFCEGEGVSEGVHVNRMVSGLETFSKTLPVSSRRFGCEKFLLNETECWCFLNNHTILSGFLGNYTQQVNLTQKPLKIFLVADLIFTGSF